MATDYQKYILSIFCLLSMSSVICHSQNLSVSTNLAGLANFGTVNMEAAYAFSRHWSVTAGGRYNPFTFSGGVEGQSRQIRQRTFAIGTRYWPWHIFSGWWAAGKLQYQEYNQGGFSTLQTSEGDRVGAGISAGYSYMIGTHFNVEAGVGVWAGLDKYVTYECPTCGKMIDSGNKTFAMLNEVLLSLAYVF